MELSVVNISGQDTGRKVVLSDAIFGIEPNDQAIYLDAKQYMANNRQGTHKSKERGEVAGSTRKLKRQKGTGGARAGDIKNPLFRGGGRIFGPRPRDYSFKLNRKLKQLARKSALSYKAAEGKITILEDFAFEAPKTKKMVEICKALNIADRKSLFIFAEKNNNILLSSRNVANLNVLTVNELSTYKLLWANNIVLVENAIAPLQENFE